MTKQELVSLIKTYGVTDETAEKIAEAVKDRSFCIGEGSKSEPVCILGVHLSNIGDQDEDTN